MNVESNLQCSSGEDASSSSFSRGNSKNEFKQHVLNLKETKTHLFYVIQSDNDSGEKSPQWIQVKVSKRRPNPRNLATKNMLSRYGTNDDGNVTDNRQQKTPKSSLISIHKRTDHPSFVVLPEISSKKRSNIKSKIVRNQSTSDNSNETYVIRSRKENQSLKSESNVSEGYCECNKVNGKTKEDNVNNSPSNLDTTQIQPKDATTINTKNLNSGENLILFALEIVSLRLWHTLINGVRTLSRNV